MGRGKSGVQNNRTPVSTLIQQYQNNQNSKGPQFDEVGDYDGNGNSKLKEWQQMSDADAAHQLHVISDNVDIRDKQYDDGFGYHDLSSQKFVLDRDLNNPATILSEKDFNDYVNQTGALVMYRGWSGQDAKTRFEEAKNSHLGNGIYGDGYYASTDIDTARGYSNGGVVSKFAISPNARVVDISKIDAEISKVTTRFQSALSKAGGSVDYGRTYGTNEGQMQMALKMGYNVIHVDRYGGDYYVALTRDALVTTKKNYY